MTNYLEKLLSKNDNTVYDDTPEDKAIIREHLAARISEAMLAPVAPIGTKNLVYFTIFNSVGYLQLLEKSLKSIVAISDTSNFDVLFITDDSFKPQIEALPIVASITPKFLIRKTPSNGIQASIQKLAVFDYSEINNYSKILFLDCDIIATQNINLIFEQLTDSENLQVASNPSLTIESRSSQYFNIDTPTDEKIKLLSEKNLTQFNAGQFAMMNSPRMRAHFTNVRWLTAVWPGAYFFEQSFMNDYFLSNEFCSKTVLLNKVKFQSVYPIPAGEKTTRFVKSNHIDGKPRYVVSINEKRSKFCAVCANIDITSVMFVHFIGAALDASIKIDCVNVFLKEKNICQ